METTLKTQHTPEPWVFHENGDGSFSVLTFHERKWVLGLIHNGDFLVERQRANLNRIVDCVNACEGMNDPKHDILTLRKALDNIKTTQRVAELQRNELFEMVRSLKDCIKRLCEDELSPYERDLEEEWIGNAHELLHKINPNYYKNANEPKTELREVVVYYKNGGKDDAPFCQATNMAANVTDEEIRAYFAPGRVFNVGIGPYDNMATVDRVEIIK